MRDPLSPRSLTAVDAGLLLLRVFTGLSLCFAHGVNKLPPSDRFVAGVAEMGFPLPLLFAWAAAFAETVGGLLLATGLATRLAAVFIAVNMFVAVFVRQAGQPFGERELALFYFVVALQFVLTGAGRLSIDAALAGWRERRRAQRS